MASPSRPCRKRPARRSSLPERPFSSRPAAAPGGPPRRSTRRSVGASAGLRGHFPRFLPSSFPSSRFVRRRCRNGRRRSQFRAIPGAVFELPEHRRSAPRRIAPGNRRARVTRPRHQLGSIPRIRKKIFLFAIGRSGRHRSRGRFSSKNPVLSGSVGHTAGPCTKFAGRCRNWSSAISRNRIDRAHRRVITIAELNGKTSNKKEDFPCRM